MKSLILTFILFTISYSIQAQVGIGNTDPKATLDITASNVATPSNTDGILIPRIDNFPSPNPTTAQEGMMVFATGNGTPTKGFYYWDNGATSWAVVSGATDTQNTLDGAYNEGGVGAGKNINASDGAVRINGEDGFLVTGTFGTGNTINTELTGAGTRMFFNPRKAAFRAGNVTANQWDDTNIGDYSVAMGRSSTASGIYDVAIGFGSLATGTYSTAIGWANRASGAYSVSIGQNSYATGWSSTAFGRISTASGSQSMVFGHDLLASGTRSIAIGNNLVVPSGYEIAMGYFGTTYTPNSTMGIDSADRLFSIGNGLNSSAKSNALTIYKDGTMNINDTYNMPLTDGTIGQVMTTDGSGVISFQTVVGDGTGTDDQNLTTPTLSGTTLNLGIESGTGTSINLATLQDGTGTDDQNLTTPTLSGTTLNLGIESGTGTSINLATLQDGTGTDDQNLTTPTLSGTTLNLGIESGTGTSINLSALQDGIGAEKINDLADAKTDAGTYSIYLGVLAGNSDNGSNNTNIGIGRNSLSAIVNNDNNIAIGSSSLALYIGNSVPGNNVVIGNNTMQNMTTGALNTVIGQGALENVTHNTNSNVAIGTYALRNLASGTENTAIGYSSGNSSNGSYNVFLGSRSGNASSGSNKLYIENTDSNTPLIYGEFDNNIVRTNGELQIGDPADAGYALPVADGAAGEVLTAAGDGTTSWSAPGSATPTVINVNVGSSVLIPAGTLTIVPFDTENFDTNSEFDTTTSQFTAATDGHYRIYTTFFVQGSATTINYGIYINGGSTPILSYSYNLNGTQSFAMEEILSLNALDVVDVRIISGVDIIAVAFPFNLRVSKLLIHKLD